MDITKQPFGKADGQQVYLYTLTNSNGIKAKITNYGATLVSLELPDKTGKFSDVTLGFDKLEDYISDSPYFGCATGRFANRIAKGRFILDAKEYKLAANNGVNHLHGGLKGFDKVVWKARTLKTEDFVGLKFHYLSPDGDQGYPGSLDTTMIYMLTNNNEFKISYEAAADKPTIVNLTNHTYWNLAGQGTGDILDHVIMINADKYTPVDSASIPTGELAAVAGTPMDFTKPQMIGSRISQVGIGYDHNYVLNKKDSQMSLAAKVKDSNSGRVMEVWTTEPGVQFYTGNFLDGTLTGKDGKVYKKHFGFCLETQHFPDSPNRPDFPSVVLRPGETYRHEVIHKFYAE